MTENEFFRILGYLSSPKRATKLDIETHPLGEGKVLNVDTLRQRGKYLLWTMPTIMSGNQVQINGVQNYVFISMAIVLLCLLLFKKFALLPDRDLVMNTESTITISSGI